MGEASTASDRPESGEPERILAAFEVAPAALFVFEGRAHRVVGANRTARNFTGDRPNLIGTPLRQALPELEGQQIFEILDEAYAAGQPISQPERRVLIDRDGDGSLEEGFFAWTFVPVDFGGGIRGIVVHAMETTELVHQRQAAEALAARSERRYQEAHELVLTLQQQLLPQGVPVLPCVRLSARYVVAAREAAAGGDFFDAVPVDDGRLVLVVGDVVGHGAPAAAAMGQLRAVALQSLASGAGMVETVRRLDALAGRLTSARGATLCLAELDPSSGTLQYLSCAHPAPLVLDADAGPMFLPLQPAAPLGVGGGVPTISTARLRPRQQLLLYSDGLVERSGRPLSDGMNDLARVGQAALNDPVGPETTLPPVLLDRVCALVIERMGTLGYGDDVTLLAAELLPTPHPGLRRRWPARADQLAEVRAAVRQWLTALDAGTWDISAILHAVQEACANAIEHAYAGGEPGTVELSGDLGPDGMVTIEIGDHGRWRSPDVDPGVRGRGLALMRGLIDAVDVVSAPDGTQVVLRHALRRPVGVGTGPVHAVPDQGRDRPFATELVRADRPVLKVAGTVDETTVDQLRIATADASRGGGIAILLDLSEVTHLASAGLQFLHELTIAADGWAGFSVVAPADGVAREVLVLSGLAGRIEV